MPKKPGVELVDAVHRSAGVDEARLGHVDAGGPELLVAEGTDRLDAGAQVGPERVHVGGAGETAGHADDGDAVAIEGVAEDRAPRT